MTLRVVLLIVVLSLVGLSTAERSFIVQGNSFVKDGQPIQLISGSMHYFRSHPDTWEDRMLKMKAAGLNTVQVRQRFIFHPGPSLRERYFAILALLSVQF
jgi:hypothetical protein